MYLGGCFCFCKIAFYAKKTAGSFLSNRQLFFLFELFAQMRHFGFFNKIADEVF